MQSDEIEYEIIGHDLQLIEIELDPGETVIAEAGAMNYMEEGISFEAKMGDGTSPSGGLSGLLSAAKRAVGGGGLFLTHFTNQAQVKRRVSFSAPYPGKVLPIKLSDFGGQFLCQHDAFLCAASGTRISIAFTKRFGAGAFGGDGFILQKLQGDGLAFVHAGGTLVQRELNNETMLIDTGCLVGLTEGIDYDIQRAGNLKSMFLGGEGLFFAKVSGTGTVMMQSLPFPRMVERIAARLPGDKH